MNSFKKISLVIAAALTGTVLATSASAAPLAVTVAGSANTTSSTAPASVTVPADNSVDSADAVAIAATADTGTVVTFTASSTVKLVTALTSGSTTVASTAGTASYSATSTGSAVTVYAYTTSTATGSVVITNGSYSTIVYVKGTTTVAYNVSVAVPAAVAVGTIPSITVSVSDIFGNAVGGETVTATLIGGTFADGSISKSIVTSTAAQVTADSTLTLGSKKENLATAVAGTVTVAVTGATSATAVTGLAAPVKAVVSSFGVTDLNGTIAALNARVSALTSEVGSLNSALVAERSLRASESATATAAAVSAAKLKAEYNALATKWNKKNPKAKVALKK